MKIRGLLSSLVFSVVLFLMFGGGALLADWAASFAAGSKNEQFADPEPEKFRGEMDEEDYLRLRNEYLGMRRGIDPDRPVLDPQIRQRAIKEMERQERVIEQAQSGPSFAFKASGGSWTALGPAPLPNGQTAGSGGTIRTSGRSVAIAVHPTNSNIVYLGTAQGGVWRSLDGGATWTNIFDSADSLAVGAVAIAPSDPTIVYVGTGEPSQSGDSFFGVGLYRIESADTTATLVGPINPSVTTGSGGGAVTYNAFTGRSISKILVHPSDPATIFVATATGVGGRGNALSATAPPLALRGIFRSNNATAAPGSVTFTKLTVTTDSSVDSPGTGNASIIDMAMEPGNPDNIVAAVIGRLSTLGGIYRTTNALSAGSFSQKLPLPVGIRSELAINKVGSTVTVYAATGETPSAGPTCTTPTGAVRKSTDGGETWSAQLTGGGGFCGGQCGYDIAVAVHPNNPNIVYLGGQARGLCSDSMKKSTDGGATFARDDTGLHADSHALAFDSAGGTIFTTNDGGVWKGTVPASGTTAWNNLNNSPLNTLQFVGIGVHPFDRHMVIGGTQDNGTEVQRTSAGNWISAEGGDGGYSLIDQSASDSTNVTMYHTFFAAANSQIYFDRALLISCLNAKNSWPTRGAISNGSGTIPDDLSPATLCDNTANLLNNGIQISDNVLFYPPMALGPGNPNTVYFGTDRLYRSTDRGDTMTIVSQSPITPTGTRTPPGGTTDVPVGSPISSIAISPQNDNFRIVGLQNGEVWGTTTGSDTLVNITSPSFPANPALNLRFIGRAMFDPNNQNVAYVAFSYFASAGQAVWKITNLSAAVASPGSANWAPAANGIPSIPVSAFAIDQANSNNLFAGTDIGVYNSTDGGATWVPYGNGLPRVAVFDMAIQNANRVLRVGTHGRGVWEIPLDVGPAIVRLGAVDFPVNENNADGFVTVTFVREGDNSLPASVNFVTSDTSSLNSPCSQPNTGKASERCDYSTSLGTVSWAAGDSATKAVNIPIINDALVEGNETFTVSLSSPVGAALGTIPAATVTIIDNDSSPSSSNPIDGVDFFITQQYIDFLGRMPDSIGFANWKNTLGNCPNGGFGENLNPTCDRIHVASGFFQSDEFLNRGYFAFRFYMVSFAQRPSYAQFIPDMAQVGGSKSPAEEEASKVAYANAFVQRPEFLTRYPGLSGQPLANALLQTAGLAPGSYNAGAQTNGQILRGIAETSAAFNKFLTEGTVSIQYFAFLRRDPDQDGYTNNVATLNANPNNLRHMIFIFIYSTEYRGRFGTP